MVARRIVAGYSLQTIPKTRELKVILRIQKNFFCKNKGLLQGTRFRKIGSIQIALMQDLFPVLEKAQGTITSGPTMPLLPPNTNTISIRCKDLLIINDANDMMSNVPANEQPISIGEVLTRQDIHTISTRRQEPGKTDP